MIFRLNAFSRISSKIDFFIVFAEISGMRNIAGVVLEMPETAMKVMNVRLFRADDIKRIKKTENGEFRFVLVFEEDDRREWVLAFYGEDGSTSVLFTTNASFRKFKRPDGIYAFAKKYFPEWDFIPIAAKINETFSDPDQQYTIRLLGS